MKTYLIVYLISGPSGSLGFRNPWLKAAGGTKLEFNGHVKRCQKSMYKHPGGQSPVDAEFCAPSHCCSYMLSLSGERNLPPLKT